MSIQRIRIERPKHPSESYLDVTPNQCGDYVLYTDHLTDKQSALDAQQAAHAAEVDRLYCPKCGTGGVDVVSEGANP